MRSVVAGRQCQEGTNIEGICNPKLCGEYYEAPCLDIQGNKYCQEYDYYSLRLNGDGSMCVDDDCGDYNELPCPDGEISAQTSKCNQCKDCDTTGC